MQSPLNTHLLPYQVRWLNDESRLKIWEKSRRIGATYVQAFEDVRDAAKQGGYDVWFTSADQATAKEYMLYCAHWASVFQVVAKDLGEIALDEDKGIKVLAIEFANGKRIHALSSNPRALRGRGGKLVVDEFAHHAQGDELWRAAQAVATWGHNIRVLSTHNGKGCRFYRMVTDAKRGKAGWSLHTTPLQKAVDEGVADKIAGRPLTKQARAAFIQECREQAGDEETFAQEYACEPIDEATAWLPWALITQAEREEAGVLAGYHGGVCYVGMDIGRRGDLSVIWVCEKIGDVLWTREVIAMRRAPFAAQLDALAGVFARYQVHRCCLDQTGMGEAVVEQAQSQHGRSAVEGVLFTSNTKQELATLGKQAFEDQTVRLPVSRVIRDSHHAVRRTTTAAGNVRFDAERNAKIGHADHFWAHMLALHAASGGEVRYAYHRVSPRGRDRWGQWDDDVAERGVQTNAGFGLTRGVW